jgi:hypothetical protein
MLIVSGRFWGQEKASSAVRSKLRISRIAAEIWVTSSRSAARTSANGA